MENSIDQQTINAVRELISEQDKKHNPPPDKEYYIFAEGKNTKTAFHRVPNPSVRLQKELDRLRMRRKTNEQSEDLKENICREMGFTMEDASEDLSELEYIEKALPLVILDMPKSFNIDEISSRVAKEAIADFLRCT